MNPRIAGTIGAALLAGAVAAMLWNDKKCVTRLELTPSTDCRRKIPANPPIPSMDTVIDATVGLIFLEENAVGGGCFKVDCPK
jgi:hypothetical protein